MNNKQAKRVLKEIARRKQRQKLEWRSPDFDTQNKFIDDPTPLKAAQTTRRAGKSYGAGLMLFQAAYNNPNTSVLYVTKTRDMAKRIMFKPILGEINRKKKLNATPNKSDLTYTLPNESVIYLLGIDNSPEEAEKLLGQKYVLVVIDEAAFISRDLENLIYEVLKPAVADYNGQIVMISTTSDMVRGFFYKVTMEEFPGWNTHKWTAYDNPFMKDKWDKEIKQLKASNPTIVDTPRFRRMYLNQWVIDEDSIIYKHNNSNLIDNAPALTDYVLGIDLGWDDATAMVVCGYREDSEDLYIVEEFKQSEMILSAVAKKIKQLESKYKHFNAIVVDNAAKQAVEEMRARYNINFKAAEKIKKKDFIEIMNAELHMGKIKLLTNSTPALQEEWSNLIWDEKAKLKGKYIEHSSCSNHLSDAALYAWRYSYTYLQDQDIEEEFIEPTSEAAVDQFWDKEIRRLERREDEDADWLEDF
jgi:PBSX family phage terminase large subunit